MTRGGAVRDGATKNENGIVGPNVIERAEKKLSRIDRTSLTVSRLSGAEDRWTGEGLDYLARRSKFFLCKAF